MKIHLLDTDPNRFSQNYKNECGSFGLVMRETNNALKKINCYSEPDDADFVGICDGLNLSFKYKNKKSFVWNVWDTNLLSTVHLKFLQDNPLIIGFSNQVKQLYSNYRKIIPVVFPGCDTEFWEPTVPKSEIFTFLFTSYTNIRSGLDLALEAYMKAFGDSKSHRLIIKTCGATPKLILNLKRLQEKYNIILLDKRHSMEELRDLYSSSHVSLNVMRHSSWGLNIHEAAACGCYPIIGDFLPSNEMVDSSYASLLKSRIIKINDIIYDLVNFGLVNSYNLSFYGSPEFYDYNGDEYAKLLLDTYNNWQNKYSKIDTRTPIIEKWSWDNTARNLVNILEKL